MPQTPDPIFDPSLYRSSGKLSKTSLSPIALRTRWTTDRSDMVKIMISEAFCGEMSLRSRICPECVCNATWRTGVGVGQFTLERLKIAQLIAERGAKKKNVLEGVHYQLSEVVWCWKGCLSPLSKKPSSLDMIIFCWCCFWGD